MTMARDTTSPGKGDKPEKPDPPAEDKIDEEIEESFPASDPPAFVNERRIGEPDRSPPPEPGKGPKDAS
jgi:hypothetical protein